ncbi:MAG: hypothetical protein COA50_05760 [Flavobacteriaceae bacterium]|nr:MAG: hypothetical protein COA50_05760 [Flavobacteriaceae bacterium]
MKLKFIMYSCLLALAISCSSDQMTDEDETAVIEEVVMEEEEEVEEEEIVEEGTSSLLMGEFVADAHPTSGTVTINEEKTQLTITGFKSDNGPVLELYIATDTAAKDFITLGVLQGLEGDFVYAIPDGATINFSTYKYVLVWCVDFSINFGHAELK